MEDIIRIMTASQAREIADKKRREKESKCVPSSIWKAINEKIEVAAKNQQYSIRIDPDDLFYEVPNMPDGDKEQMYEKIIIVLSSFGFKANMVAHIMYKTPIPGTMYQVCEISPRLVISWEMGSTGGDLNG